MYGGGTTWSKTSSSLKYHRLFPIYLVYYDFSFSIQFYILAENVLKKQSERLSTNDQPISFSPQLPAIIAKIMSQYSGFYPFFQLVFSFYLSFTYDNNVSHYRDSCIRSYSICSSC